MADFTSGFWNIWIVVLTVLGIIGCALLLWQQSTWKVKKGEQPGAGATTGHVWDEDLTELNNPLPRWWMWLFYLTIVFSVGYLVVYPGLGNFAGTLGWKSTAEHDDDVRAANAKYGPLFDNYLKQDLKQVAADPQAHAIGERLFLTYCAQCHGSDARGNKGFPNLTDDDWLHGGAPETIKETIMKGRHGVMPPMGAALGSDKDVDNVANYVLSLSDSTHDPIKAELGKSRFGACMACHGAGGKGNQALGAPNLSDKIWLYGGSIDTIKETITKGRDNTMPAFGEFLGEPKVHVLAAYVWSLSNRPSNAAAK
ncbi:cytochrome-c oxidase, cbb3-type subunit III [Herbaspirillum sp.]|uniref:cytochrome-c oxidase, cbb3-type subunit III n=1 Tax=Herbaspirillum sp. TaxID=1890675 RepID=UPI001AFE755B|nr:cytochrome-c oxidase, cbb3-type subunit III [Herbaspirillum sp.]MBO9538380.1 cytochrome-c oxidase, cbb3-type subunit III [Herbaspirillum sp.]